MTHEQIRQLIQTAPSIEKADELITEATKLTTVQEKAAYVRGIFGMAFDKLSCDLVKADYYEILQNILNMY